MYIHDVGKYAIHIVLLLLLRIYRRTFLVLFSYALFVDFGEKLFLNLESWLSWSTGKADGAAYSTVILSEDLARGFRQFGVNLADLDEARFWVAGKDLYRQGADYGVENSGYSLPESHEHHCLHLWAEWGWYPDLFRRPRESREEGKGAVGLWLPWELVVEAWFHWISF